MVRTTKAAFQSNKTRLKIGRILIMITTIEIKLMKLLNSRVLLNFDFFDRHIWVAKSGL